MIRRRQTGRLAAYGALFALTAALIALKFGLLSHQLAQITPNSAGIDDTLLYEAAKSVAAGDWLGEYNALTLGKHMLFSVWLAFTHTLGVSFLAAGQALYLAACAAAAWALRPCFRYKYWLFGVFWILWWSPYSWAQFTTRVYRDNIFPSLCLLFFAGAVGMVARYRERPARALPFAALAGVALGAAWLDREDGVWLLPFALCAALAYAVLALLAREDFRTWLRRMVAPLAAFALFLGCLGGYSWMNYRHYGRFIVSDFTSSEFEDAVGALVRADDELHDANILVCYEARQRIAAVSPLYAQLEKQFAAVTNYYSGFAIPETNEFKSGGYCWALRLAAGDLGYYADARTAQAFWRGLADEVNAACESGAIPTSRGKTSTTLMPWHKEYLSPTLREMGRSFRCLLGFEQTSCLGATGDATYDQYLEYTAFLHTDAYTAVNPDTGGTLYIPAQLQADARLAKATAVYRGLIVPLLLLGLAALFLDLRDAVRELRAKAPGVVSARAVLLLGVALSAILRVAIVSYVEAVSFQIGTYLLYLSSAGPLLLLFGAYGLFAAADRLLLRLGARRGAV